MTDSRTPSIESSQQHELNPIQSKIISGFIDTYQKYLLGSFDDIENLKKAHQYEDIIEKNTYLEKHEEKWKFYYLKIVLAISKMAAGTINAKELQVQIENSFKIIPGQKLVAAQQYVVNLMTSKASFRDNSKMVEALRIYITHVEELFSNETYPIELMNHDAIKLADSKMSEGVNNIIQNIASHSMRKSLRIKKYKDILDKIKICYKNKEYTEIRNQCNLLLRTMQSCPLYYLKDPQDSIIQLINQQENVIYIQEYRENNKAWAFFRNSLGGLQSITLDLNQTRRFKKYFKIKTTNICVTDSISDKQFIYLRENLKIKFTYTIDILSIEIIVAHNYWLGKSDLGKSDPTNAVACFNVGINEKFKVINNKDNEIHAMGTIKIEELYEASLLALYYQNKIAESINIINEYNTKIASTIKTHFISTWLEIINKIASIEKKLDQTHLDRLKGLMNKFPFNYKELSCREYYDRINNEIICYYSTLKKNIHQSYTTKLITEKKSKLKQTRIMRTKLEIITQEITQISKKIDLQKEEKNKLTIKLTEEKSSLAALQKNLASQRSRYIKIKENYEKEKKLWQAKEDEIQQIKVAEEAKKREAELAQQKSIELQKQKEAEIQQLKDAAESNKKEAEIKEIRAFHKDNLEKIAAYKLEKEANFRNSTTLTQATLITNQQLPKKMVLPPHAKIFNAAQFQHTVLRLNILNWLATIKPLLPFCNIILKGSGALNVILGICYADFLARKDLTVTDLIANDLDILFWVDNFNIHEKIIIDLIKKDYPSFDIFKSNDNKYTNLRGNIDSIPIDITLANKNIYQTNSFIPWANCQLILYSPNEKCETAIEKRIYDPHRKYFFEIKLDPNFEASFETGIYVIAPPHEAYMSYCYCVENYRDKITHLLCNDPNVKKENPKLNHLITYTEMWPKLAIYFGQQFTNHSLIPYKEMLAFIRHNRFAHANTFPFINIFFKELLNFKQRDLNLIVKIPKDIAKCASLVAQNYYFYNANNNTTIEDVKFALDSVLELVLIRYNWLNENNIPELWFECFYSYLQEKIINNIEKNVPTLKL